MDCEWIHLDGCDWQCAHCGGRRAWHRDGAPPHRNCLAPAHPADQVQPAGTVRRMAPRAPGCLHRGAASRDVTCPTCAGHVQVKVFSCALHGECTLGKKDIGVRRCDGCADRAPAYKLEFFHGLGDAVQATSLVAHFRRQQPAVPLAVRCRPGQEGLFRAAGADIGFDGPATHVIEWREPARSFAGLPSTKLESCLLDECGLAPEVALCRYKLDVPAELLERARQEVRRVGTRPTLFLQWYGSSVPDKKNLEPADAAAITAAADAAGYQVLLWDPEHRFDCKLHPGAPGARMQIVGHEFLRPIAATPADAPPDAMALAALLAVCDHVIAIDSGPGLMCQALNNARGQRAPKTLIVWTKHHPVHYACPAPNVEHLVPDDHGRLIYRPIAHGLEYFEQHYAFRTYGPGSGAGNAESDMINRVKQWLSEGPPPVPSALRVPRSPLPASAPLASPDWFGGPNECFNFLVPAGLGDISWIYSKIRHLKRITNRETILYCPGGDTPRRGGDFIELLPDVHWGGYYAGKGSWEVLSQSLPPSWPAKMGTWEFLNKPHVQNLAANLHLEAGGKLADWLPWLPVDYHYPLSIPPADQQAAAAIMLSPERNPDAASGLMPQANSRFIGVYVSGSDKDAAKQGGWSLWDETTWVDFLCQVADTRPMRCATFVLLGAAYDRDKTVAVADALERCGHDVRRVIAEPLGVALECLKRCQYAFCYPSGIGILANVLRVPGVMLLPWCLSELAATYADPCDLAARRYRAWPDPQPAEVLDWCQRSSWPALGW